VNDELITVPRQRLEELEASVAALWEAIKALTEEDTTPKLERPHRELVARLRKARGR